MKFVFFHHNKTRHSQTRFILTLSARLAFRFIYLCLFFCLNAQKWMHQLDRLKLFILMIYFYIVRCCPGDDIYFIKFLLLLLRCNSHSTWYYQFIDVIIEKLFLPVNTMHFVFNISWFCCSGEQINFPFAHLNCTIGMRRRTNNFCHFVPTTGHSHFQKVFSLYNFVFFLSIENLDRLTTLFFLIFVMIWPWDY